MKKIFVVPLVSFSILFNLVGCDYQTSSEQNTAELTGTCLELYEEQMKMSGKFLDGLFGDFKDTEIYKDALQETIDDEKNTYLEMNQQECSTALDDLKNLREVKNIFSKEQNKKDQSDHEQLDGDSYSVVSQEATSMSKQATSIFQIEKDVKEAALKMTADELLDAYKENEGMANKKYKGKILLVNGFVDHVQAGSGNRAYVVLKAGEPSEAILPQAHFKNPENDKIIKLNKGQKIRLLCIGGGEIIGIPILQNCTF